MNYFTEADLLENAFLETGAPAGKTAESEHLFNSFAAAPTGFGSFPTVKQNCFHKKTAVCFGDSITWYDGHAYNWGKEAGKTARGYESYLRKAGMTVQNEGISNATIREIRERILQTSVKGFDYIFLTSGANDSRFNIPTGELRPQGSAFDTTSFFGCLQSSIEHIRENNSAGNLILITPLGGWIYAPQGYAYPRTEDGRVEKRFADAILQAGALYDCPVCDWYNKIELDEAARPALINDPEPDDQAALNPNPLYSVHPSTEGYQIMARLLFETMRNA